MYQSKKGNDWHFGMKAHVGVDAASGPAHTVIGTAGNVSDVTQAAPCCTATSMRHSATRATRVLGNARRIKANRSPGMSP